MCSTEKLKEFLTLKELKKELENSIKEIETEIYKDYGHEKNTIYQDNIIIKINLINRVSMDTKKLKMQHPALYEMYKKEISYNTIKIEVKV